MRTPSPNWSLTDAGVGAQHHEIGRPNRSAPIETKPPSPCSIRDAITLPMRKRLGDGRYRKTWEKMIEPAYEFHPELDVQTAG